MSNDGWSTLLRSWRYSQVRASRRTRVAAVLLAVAVVCRVCRPHPPRLQREVSVCQASWRRWVRALGLALVALALVCEPGAKPTPDAAISCDGALRGCYGQCLCLDSTLMCCEESVCWAPTPERICDE